MTQMPVKKNACKDCVHYSKVWGNKDLRGNRIPSREWCIARNGTIKKHPVICDLRETDKKR